MAKRGGSSAVRGYSKRSYNRALMSGQGDPELLRRFLDDHPGLLSPGSVSGWPAVISPAAGCRSTRFYSGHGLIDHADLWTLAADFKGVGRGIVTSHAYAAPQIVPGVEFGEFTPARCIDCLEPDSGHTIPLRRRLAAADLGFVLWPASTSWY